jgi:23S rRNA G2069 N7-methylase RlmK/C1962 C5-methylase RlmI
MSYKKGLSKTKFKNAMRMFWTQRWKYERTPDQWVEALKEDGTRYWSSSRFKLSTSFTKDLLEDALDKLVLEKKLKKDEAENLKNMLASTEEDAYLALIVMAGLKPKKFKKNVEKLSGVQ